jgi:hypothetical protein
VKGVFVISGKNSNKLIHGGRRIFFADIELTVWLARLPAAASLFLGRRLFSF